MKVSPRCSVELVAESRLELITLAGRELPLCRTGVVSRDELFRDDVAEASEERMLRKNDMAE